MSGGSLSTMPLQIVVATKGQTTLHTFYHSWFVAFIAHQWSWSGGSGAIILSFSEGTEIQRWRGWGG
jgi:hypothetical protein